MTKIIIPTSRPRMSFAEVANLPPFISAIEGNPTAARWPVRLIGIRGYYANTLGLVGRNDIGLYDDALFFEGRVNGLNVFESYNFNTEPSLHENNIATLATGVWWFQKHMHHGKYAAFGQSRPVSVHRWHKPDDYGMFGINIHYAGIHGTGSLGCQTLPKYQFLHFQSVVYRAMSAEKVQEIPYFLIDSPATIET